METVIILDKIPLMRRAIGALLHALNLKVIAETDCEQQLLCLAQELNPCLIILDAQLCAHDGFALIKTLRAFSKQVRLVILADRDSDSIALCCVRAGACAYISKAINLESLQSVIQNIRNGYVVFPKDVLEAMADYGGPKKHELALQLVSLSKREQVVLKYLYEGYSNKKIAELLDLNPRTISTYKLRILSKLGLTSLMDIAVLPGLHKYLSQVDVTDFCKKRIQSIQRYLQF